MAIRFVWKTRELPSSHHVLVPETGTQKSSCFQKHGKEGERVGGVESSHGKLVHVSRFLGILDINHFQALSTILREQNQAFSGKIRHFDTKSGTFKQFQAHDFA